MMTMIFTVWLYDNYDFWQYGFINTCLRTLVVEKFGEDTWDQLRYVGEYFFALEWWVLLLVAEVISP